MQDNKFTDAELVAYLDGEKEFTPYEEIKRALRTDPALRKRLDDFFVDTDALALGLETLQPDEGVAPIILKPSRFNYGIGGLALVGVLALVVGLGMGTWISKPDQGWTNYVAAYQALYSPNTLAHIDQSDADQVAELERVASAIGKSIPIEKLKIFPEVDYKRAQILNFEGRTLIQLAFVTGNGEPMALCILRTDEAAQNKPTQSVMEGMQSAYWSHVGYEYLLIGGADAALVKRLADSFASLEI
jgi:hypothetical protein